MSRLPEEAHLAQADGQDRIWTHTHELLATAVEVMSINVAQKALKEPITVPRPQIKTRYIDPSQWEAVERARGAVSISDAVGGPSGQRTVRRVTPPAPKAAP